MIGAFESVADARMTIEDLRDADFTTQQIGILTHDRDGDPDVKSIRQLGGNFSGAGAAMGAAAGAGSGALWGLAIAAGVMPAIGPVIAGGLLVALAASAMSGAAAGLLLGALIGLGLDDDDAAYYDAAFRQGHTVLVVHPGARAQLVQTIMTAHHAYHRQVVATATLAEQVDRRHA